MDEQRQALPVLVTGGTGTLGRHVVRRLRDAGYGVRILTRRQQPDADGITHVIGDLATGDGVEGAMAGVETVVHCAGSAKGDDAKARTLVNGAVSTGARHLVAISVVGCDRIPQESWIDRMMFGYFGNKLAAERIVAESGMPWTILRATQFHDLMFKVVDGMAKLPVIPVPRGFRFQPIDADEVAGELTRLALDRPAGSVTEMGGPSDYLLADMVRDYAHLRGKRRLIVPVPLPGKAAEAFRSGANLAPDRAAGRRTWEEFVAERSGARREPAASGASVQQR